MKLYFMASPTSRAQEAFDKLARRYGQARNVAESDVIVAIGGDGQTLQALQEAIKWKKPVFGLHFGHSGFMQNPYEEGDDLPARILAADGIKLYPLHVKAQTKDGCVHEAFAINEAHVCNHHRAGVVFLQVKVGGQVRIPHLSGDGLIISTMIGSTAYNKSARGPILPLGNDLIALTPNNPHTPIGMVSCLIRPSQIEVEVKEPDFRPADLYADAAMIAHDVRHVDVALAPRRAYRLLFDRGVTLHEKIMRTQFATASCV